MSCIKVPITKTDKGGFQVTIDLNLYSEKAITATIYRYTDKFFVYQNTMPNDDKKVWAHGEFSVDCPRTTNQIF